MTNSHDVEADIADEVSKIPLKEVLQKAKQSEDRDVAYIMAMQLNCMYEANRALRMSALLTEQDVTTCFRIMDYMIRERAPRTRQTTQ
jgi:hypothetical protein